KVPGDYLLAGTFTYSTDAFILVFKNGSLQTSLTAANTSKNSGAVLLTDLAYGDEISIRAGANGNLQFSEISIHRIETSGRVYKTRVAYLKDVKPSGTAGGTFTSGSWQTRDLNTIEGDSSFVSLASNQFTLQPGTYHIE